MPAAGGIEAQTCLARKNILAMLEKAGMTTADLVKVTTSLTDENQIPSLRESARRDIRRREARVHAAGRHSSQERTLSV